MAQEMAVGVGKPFISGLTLAWKKAITFRAVRETFNGALQRHGQPDRLLRVSRRSNSRRPRGLEGRVVAMLLRAGARPSRGAVSTFTALAIIFSKVTWRSASRGGLRVYALDLRKHGRRCCPPIHALQDSPSPSDITRALAEIDTDVLLAGHSTGGLICSLYKHQGELRDRVRALWLNSPFFEFNASSTRLLQLKIARDMGLFFPFLNNPNAVLPAYVESLHKNWTSNGTFDLNAQTLLGFPRLLRWWGDLRAHVKVPPAGGACRCCRAFGRGRHHPH